MLPVNFHKTFVPERSLISALLNYAALGNEGDYQQISVETGIPMGKSTGKVPAILDYARGMGLIEVAKRANGIKKPTLTDLGRIVYQEDRMLGEEIIQWLIHMNLCRSDIGASAWYAVFAEGRDSLGSSFDKEQLERYLVGVFGDGNNRTGPLLAAYLDDAALKRCGALIVEGAQIIRKKAPIRDSYAFPYTAFLLQLLEDYFSGQSQVTLSDFQARTGWFNACLWSDSEVETVLSMVEKKGLLTVDRQMRPWILEKRSNADQVWKRIFEDLG